MVGHLPSGTVSLLFTDIEDSSRLWDVHRARMAEALEIHTEVVSSAITAHEGLVVKDKGDGVFAVFASARDAVVAAIAVQTELAAASWPDEVGPLHVRMAIHTGPAEPRDGDYHGPTINRVARLEGLAHGGQVLVSETTQLLTVDDLPDGVRLRDMGIQRLRGLERPERVYQLEAPGLRHRFPPLRSDDVAGVPLPTFPTSFVGRTREMAEIADLVGGNGRRLVTLLGPGGIGKTRLAVETGRLIAQQLTGGAAFVDLAKVTMIDEVAPAIARAVGAHAEGTASPIALAAARLSEPALLVIDNFEHVSTASPTVAELLEAAPRVRCIATSRTPLRIQGERLYAVEPLGDAEDWSAATELFYDRATGYGAVVGREGADADAVRAICRRLDGLPLAIELVAARTRLLGVQELDRLLARSLDALGTGAADLPERQRTIRSTIDWSLASLTEEQRSLFAQLSVFPAGARFDAIEQVCRCGVDVLGDVAALVDNSLLSVVTGEPGGTRYRQLAPLREYGAELLGVETDAVMHRLVDHYRAAAPDLGRRLEFGREAERELNAEHTNLLATMQWTLDHERVDDMARVLVDLWIYWFNGDLAKPAADWAVAADARSQSAELDWLRGFFGFQTGDFAVAAQRMERAIGELDARGEAYLAALARAFAGMMSSDLDEGRRLLEAADAYLAKPGHGLSRFTSTIFLSFNAMQRGDVATTIELRRDILDRTASLGHDVVTGWAHENLAAALILSGDLDAAWEHNRLAAELLIAEGSQEGVATVAEIEAIIDYREGRVERSLELVGAAEPIWRSLGTVRWPEAELLLQEMLGDARSSLGVEAAEALLREGAAIPMERVISMLSESVRPTPPAEP